MRNSCAIIAVALATTFTVAVGCGKKRDAITQPQPNPLPIPQPGPGSGTPSQPGPGTPTRAPLGEPKYRVTAKQLLSEHVADKKNGLAKYVGQVIEVTGTTTIHAGIDIDDVRMSAPAGRVAGYKASLILEESQPNANPGGSNSVMIWIRGVDRAALPKVFKGQLVKVKARVDSVDGILILKEGELLDSGKENPLRMKAEDVAAEAEKSLDELAKKCEAQTLLVSGVVLGMVKEGDNEFVELKGTGKTRILCELSDGVPLLYSNGFAPGEQVLFSSSINQYREKPGSGRVILEVCVPLHRQPTAAEATRRP